MKKFLLSIILLGTVFSAHAWDQRASFPLPDCQIHAPWGFPSIHGKSNVTGLCREGYALLHDNQAKIPVWVAWEIKPQNINGCVARTNAFVSDHSLGNNSARPDDYAGSGYDKGHLANDAHQSWSTQVEYESFLMSNMSPQLPGLNRGIWKLLETATGAWGFSSQHTMIVFAGNVYDVTKDKKIGPNNVDVPQGLFKIVIDKNTGATLAFLFPHKENQGNDLTVVQVTVKDVEKATGIVFSIPKNHKKTVKEPIWPVDFKSVADNKKAICRG